MRARFSWSLWLAGATCALAACNAVFGVDAGSSTSGGVGAAGSMAGAGGATGGAGTGGVDAMSTTSAGAGGSDPVASSRLAVGFARACVIEDDGSVRCWGDNSGGDLVSADPRADVPVAEAVPGVATAVQIAAGGGQQCVLQVDGSVVCWGDDDDGELGSQGAPSTPGTVPGLTRSALEVEATQGCTCARLSDDTVECWGQQQTGCLGVPSTTAAISGPVAVPGVAGAIQLVVGAYGDPSCARLASGQVICWSQTVAPAPIPGVTDAIAVAAGSGYVFVLRAMGTVVWSAASASGLGWSPAQLYPTAEGMTAITAGGSFCGLGISGAVACAGLDGAGTLPSPVPIAGQPAGAVLEIAAGYGGTYGESLQCLLLAGSPPPVYCWGDDLDGALGAGAPEDLTAPAAVPGVGVATSVTAGVTSTSVVLADGSVAFWGSDQALAAAETATPVAVSSLGTGNVAVESNDVGEIAYVLRQGAAPALLEEGTIVAEDRLLLSGFTDFRDVRSSSAWDLGLRAGGTVVVYGVGVTSNADGIFGDGTTASTVDETETVPGITTATALAAHGNDYGSQPAHACVILGPSGAVACWGGNHAGEVGSGVPSDTEPVTTPTLVTLPGDDSIVSLAAGDRFTCAAGASGKVYCWGLDDVGQLGIGGNISSPVPVAVSGIDNALGVTALQAHACAWLADQTVKCWGANDAGQLGDGTLIDRGAPVAVAGLAGVVQVAAGAEHTCARRADGSVACWGSSYDGQVGTGVTGIYPSPLPVQGL